MDAVGIGVIIFVVIFMVVGLIFAHYGEKVSNKIQQEEIKKKKEK